MKKSVLPFACKNVAALTDKKSVMKLSLLERFWMFSHLAICKSCQCYEKQSAALARLTENLLQKPVEQKQLSEETKLRIIRTITKE